MSSAQLPPCTSEACRDAKWQRDDSLHAMGRVIADAAMGGVPYVPDSRARVTDLPGGPLAAALYYPVNLAIAGLLEVINLGYWGYKVAQAATCAIGGATHATTSTCDSARAAADGARNTEAH